MGVIVIEVGDSREEKSRKKNKTKQHQQEKLP